MSHWHIGIPGIVLPGFIVFSHLGATDFLLTTILIIIIIAIAQLAGGEGLPLQLERVCFARPAGFCPARQPVRDHCFRVSPGE